MFHLEASNQTLITLFGCFDDQLVCATWSQNVNQGENVAQIEVCRLIMYCASILEKVTYRFYKALRHSKMVEVAQSILLFAPY